MGRDQVPKFAQPTSFIIMEKQTIKFQVYRIIEFEGEIKPGVDIPMVFEFLPFGSKGILRPPYKTIIHVNEFTGKVVYTECNCIDCDMKRNENCKRFAGKDYKCKHIKQGELELIEDKHLTESKQETSQGCGKKISVKDGNSNHESFCGCDYKGLHLCDSCSIKNTNLEVNDGD